MIIAIDGPAGAGKSTVAALLAKKLGYLYINTGAMYRAVTWKALQDKVNTDNESDLVELAKKCDIEFRDGGSRIFLNAAEITKQIRAPEVDRNISTIVKFPELRKIMVKQQREFGKQGDIVSEGRDVTTVVFPDADVKIYLDASISERAKRRYNELKEKGYEQDFEQVKQETSRRDENDKTRDHGPLRIAPDAIIVDSTNKTINEVVEEIFVIIQKAGL